MIADGLIVDSTVNTAPRIIQLTQPLSLVKISFYCERNKQAERKPKERTRLTWAKPRSVAK